MLTLSVLLKKKRLEKGLSQLQIAKMFGYTSAQFVSNWERDQSTPPPTTWKKLCNVLDISKEELKAVMLDDLSKQFDKQFSKRWK